MTPEDLVELRAIEELKYRYLRSVDLRLWDELAEVLAPEATASYGGGAHRATGREAIVGFLAEVMGSQQILTSHKCHHPEIILSQDRCTASGIWALDDVVINQERGVTIRGAAFYEDEYAKVDGRWYITRTGYKRVYEEVYPRSSVRGLTVTADFWATGGRSQLGGASSDG